MSPIYGFFFMIMANTTETDAHNLIQTKKLISRWCFNNIIVHSIIIPISLLVGWFSLPLIDDSLGCNNERNASLSHIGNCLLDDVNGFN